MIKILFITYVTNFMSVLSAMTIIVKIKAPEARDLFENVCKNSTFLNKYFLTSRQFSCSFIIPCKICYILKLTL